MFGVEGFMFYGLWFRIQGLGCRVYVEVARREFEARGVVDARDKDREALGG